MSRAFIYRLSKLHIFISGTHNVQRSAFGALGCFGGGGVACMGM